MLDEDIELPVGTTFMLVIDTDAYSGNFERELGGFCTGAYDGATHGDNEQALFLEAEGEIGQRIMNKVTFLTHREYGEKPVCIRATPGRLNNGMGQHYDADSDAEIMKAKAKEAMRDYQAPHIKRCEERLANEDFEDESKPGAWTKEACERTIQSALASIERAGQNVAYPAYESVAVFLSEPLTEEEMAVVTRRVNEYAANPKAFTNFGNDPFKVRAIYQTKMTNDRTEERL